MDREVHKSRSFADAERHDREQQWRMTPDERLLAAAELRERVFYCVELAVDPAIVPASMFESSGR